jgi:hypothetical protein
MGLWLVPRERSAAGAGAAVAVVGLRATTSSIPWLPRRTFSKAPRQAVGWSGVHALICVLRTLVRAGCCSADCVAAAELAQEVWLLRCLSADRLAAVAAQLQNAALSACAQQQRRQPARLQTKQQQLQDCWPLRGRRRLYLTPPGNFHLPRQAISAAPGAAGPLQLAPR